MMRDTSNWVISGTKTYRLGSRKVLSLYGGNLQNVEKGMREIYVADEGKILVQTDQSGADALIVAYDSEPGDYRKLFQCGVKPHVYVALHLFKEVWHQKMRQYNLIGDTGLDLDVILKTPIPELKSQPGFHNLDSLIKDSDNWSVNERYYYLAKQTCHCVDDKTEVLTLNGWINVSNYSNQQIAVMDFNRNIKFETPSKWNSFDYLGKMIKLYGDEVDQLITPNHRVVYKSNGKLHIKTAQEMAGMGRRNIPNSGYYCGGSVHVDNKIIQLLVAIQADGNWYSENNVRFRFVKERKINRLENLLTSLNIPFEKRLTDVTEFYVKNISHILQYFNGQKYWNSWLLNFSRENLEVFLSELKFWDGTYCESFRHKREEYISKHPINVKWVKTIAHLLGKQGTVLCDGDVYTCGLNSRQNSIAWHYSQLDYNGKVYCPTTSTGLFIMRRNGKISITGNSANYGIQADTFRMNILEKSGGKIVVDKPEAERFLQVYRGLFPEIPGRNRRIALQAKETKMLYNMYGHPYYISQYEPTERNLMEYYSWNPQSTVGMITNIAIVRMQEYIETNGLDWDILLNVHDSMTTQCPIADLNHCAAKQKEFIEQEFLSTIDHIPFKMKSDTMAGFNGAPRKEKEKDGQKIVINPEGLKEIKVTTVI